MRRVGVKRMGFTGRWGRAAVTAAAAYALVLQVLLLAFGGALQAAQAVETQAVVCLQGGASGADHGPAQTHDGLCCTLSCHGAGAAPPPAVGVLLPRVPIRGTAVAAGATPVHHPATKVLPVGPRAPPQHG